MVRKVPKKLSEILAKTIAEKYTNTKKIAVNAPERYKLFT